MNAFSLDGETALITGGGSGIGLGIAHCFVEAGAKVILVGRDSSRLENACRELGSSAAALPHDITRLEDAEALLESAGKIFGQAPGILVNNAGNHLKKPALQTSNAEFENLMRTHVTASHALTAAALPAMLHKGHGSIIFIVSMATFMGVPNIIAYTAAKSALAGMTRALASEVSPRGVRVNAIAPGWIGTNILRNALANDPERERKILSRTPMARFGDPEDIGWAATYLCSPAAKFITGTIVAVDGGASIGF